ncbi:MAG: methyltransferase domain-containing protein [Thermoanaerobaculia bacterium]|nr:methyltransferase domain-containing protein [Thermoanaerobaculia bacterium]
MPMTPTATEPASRPLAVHRPAWDDAAIERFWAYWSTREQQDPRYFTWNHGTGILNLAHFAGALRGRVLDYGCGRGILTRKLLRRGVEVQGLEFSQAAAERLDLQLGDTPGWLGTTVVDQLPAPLAQGSFDLVFCIEVIEHLGDAWLEATLDELARLLRPGGHLLLTTPCAEDLEAAFVFCPFCGSQHHHMQHLRSIEPGELRRWLETRGFEVLLCQGLRLEHFRDHARLPAFADLSLRRLAEWTGCAALRLLDRWFPTHPPGRTVRRLAREPGPHLCALARKR